MKRISENEEYINTSKQSLESSDYIIMIHVTKELDLTERSFSINPVIKCIPNLFYSNLFLCLRICGTAAIRKVAILSITKFKFIDPKILY